MRSKKGNFIVFEGIDGSGKTAQSRLLTERLNRMHLPYHATVEPTHNLIGSLIRKHTNTGEIKLDERVIAQLFAADRLDHLTNPDYGNLKKLEDGIHVIQDRYYLSSIGYQGTLTNQVEFVTQLNRICMELRRPDITIFLDIDPKLSMERISSKRANVETYESYELQRSFMRRYIETRDLLISEGERFLTVDGSMEMDEIAEIIWEELQPMFS